MNHDQIVKQSKQAYLQWCEQWRANAVENSKYKMKSFEDFRNTGIGKAILLVANGYSLEENMETIKANADNVDIMACDKTLGHLIRNGIRPKYVMVCDANVNYDYYLKPYEDQLQGTILIMNVCANPLWAANGNWKDKYFYVNKDVMKNEIEFKKLSGCPNVITAGTNVSNMMVVVLNQSDNEIKQNLFAYDKILLIGYDYSWRFDGKYYAYDEEGGGKRFYMRHIYGISESGKLIFTSNNLNSSASWLALYIKAYRINTIQCGKHTIQSFGKSGDLATQMRYRHKPSDSKKVIELLKEQRSLEQNLNKIQNDLQRVARDHWFSSHSI